MNVVTVNKDTKQMLCIDNDCGYSVHPCVSVGCSGGVCAGRRGMRGQREPRLQTWKDLAT